MSRKERDHQSQINSLKSELELSTFLNKGVLQSNSEYKLRIVELERENSVLRVAESRLARTEDRLEVAEKRVEKEVRERMRVEEDNVGLRGEIEVLKERVERMDGLERKFEAIRRLVVVEDVKAGSSVVSVSVVCCERSDRHSSSGEESHDIHPTSRESSFNCLVAHPADSDSQETSTSRGQSCDTA